MWPSQPATPDESPKIACARRRVSSCTPVSSRRALLNAAGTRNSPAVSPTVRAGWRALGSRVNANDEPTAARGRIQVPTRGVREIDVVTSRCVSRPTSLPNRAARCWRSEEHTSELQSRLHLVCRLLLEKKEHTSELQSRLHLVCRLLLEKKKPTSELPSLLHHVGPLLVYNNKQCFPYDAVRR